MNSVAKGNRIQRLFKNKLLTAGFIIDGKPRMRFPKKTHENDYTNTTDIWGRFDIVAIHPTFEDYTWLFQISTQWKSGKQRTEIENFPYKKYHRVCMVRKKDGQDFELKIWEANLKVWVQLTLFELNSYFPA